MSQLNRLSENQTPPSEYSLRKMYEYYQGPIYKMFSRLPSYNTQLNSVQIMRYKTIMASMTDNELDGPKPEQMSLARMQEIARGSRQDVQQVSEMLKEYKRLKKAWINLERYASDTRMMDTAALFWNEIATPFHVETVPEPEDIPFRLPPRKLPPRKKNKKLPPPKKFELMELVKWTPIFGLLYCFLRSHKVKDNFIQ